LSSHRNKDICMAINSHRIGRILHISIALLILTMPYSNIFRILISGIHALDLFRFYFNLGSLPTLISMYTVYLLILILVFSLFHDAKHSNIFPFFFNLENIFNKYLYFETGLCDLSCHCSYNVSVIKIVTFLIT